MKKTFFTTNGPKAVGPYCSAVIDQDTVYLSGVIGLVLETGRLASGGTEGETQQVLSNLKTILNELGLDFANVLKTTVYLVDMSEFAVVNSLYAKVFGPDYPARSCVQVGALPAGARVEIECTATKTL